MGQAARRRAAINDGRRDMTDQSESNEQKRREALNRLRATHGTPTRPQGLGVNEDAERTAETAAGPGVGGPGAAFRARLAQGGAGGAGLGGGALRARLAQQGGAGLGGGLGAGLGAGLGGGLRARFAQQGGAVADAAQPGAAMANDPEQARAFLRERIGQLQARLDALDKAAAEGKVEDAVVYEDSPAPGKSGG
jgi:hypothetical protein